MRIPATIPAMALLVMTAACPGSQASGMPLPSAADAAPVSPRAAPDADSHNDRTPARRQWPLIPGETRGDSPVPMMPGRIHAPTVGPVTCPSLNFEQFFHAFLNNGDLQVAYTAKPYVLKGPYYLKHNTEPGDPANPQWATVEINQPIHGYYRFDARKQAYVFDTSRLRPGQQWTGIDAFGKPTDHPTTELTIRRVSDIEYVMETRDRLTTFSKRADCWYLTHDWTLDPFEGCQWPDQCRSMREYEGGNEED